MLLELNFSTGSFDLLLEDAAAAKGLLVGDVYGDFPLSQTERYQSFSKYPYIVRDVAAWFPADVDATKIETLIKNEAGELCIKISLFDKFEKAAKDGAPAKTSLAFRLIFQSFDRTLTDDDANSAMEKVYSKLKAEGFEIR